MTTPAGHIHLSIPTLESGRLRLRAPMASDFEAYAAFCASDRSAMVGGPYDRAGAFSRFTALTGHWAFHGFGRWVVADRESDEALGVVGPMAPPDWPEAEIAWTVFEAAEGRGIAREAALMSRAFVYDRLGWSTVVSCVAPDNHRSAALARRLGAVEDGAFEHPSHGRLIVFRHPSPAALAAAAPLRAATS